MPSKNPYTKYQYENTANTMATLMSPEDLILSISQSPYDKDTYDRVIDLLKVQNAGFHYIKTVRQAKLLLFALDAQDTIAWLQDTHKLDDEQVRNDETINVYRILTTEYPTAQNWAHFLKHLFDTSLDATEEIAAALADTEHDYQNGSLVWDLVIDHYTEKFKKTQNPADFDTLRDLHLRRLAIPHATLLDSFSAFSQFISLHDNDNYEKQLLVANKIYQKSTKQQRYFDMFELKLRASPNDPSVWIPYIEQVFKYSTKDMAPIKVSTLFYRALFSSPSGQVGDPDWIPIWLTYIYILYQLEDQDRVRKVLQTFLRCYPNSSASFAEYVRNLSHSEEDVIAFLEIRKRISLVDLMHKEDYDSWKVTALALLTFQFSVIQKTGAVDLVESLYLDIAEFTSFAIEKNNDAFHSVEKLAVVIYEELQDLDSARGLISDMVEKFPDQFEVWLFAIDFERRQRSEHGVISGIFKSATLHFLTMDWPERVILEWLNFEQLFGDMATLHLVITTVNDKLKEIQASRLESRQKIYAESQKRELKPESPVPANKRQKTEPEELKRSREDFSVKVSQLPQNITEGEISDFFSDCGSVRDVKLFQEKDEPCAIIELSGQQDVLTALTKNLKQIGGNKILVEQFAEATIWVANFPPSMSHERIKVLFGEVGVVVDARFPTQKAKKDRRFCYIEYASHEVAVKAQAHFNNYEIQDEIEGHKFKMKVALSSPPEERRRVEAHDYSREVFIQNLNFKTVTEDILRAAFEQYGTIELIKLPLSEKNRSSGNLNNGYGFVVFKSAVAATNALAFSGTQLEKRQVNVTLSKPQERTHQFVDANTISLMNLDDTITSQQVKLLLSQKVGPVERVELFPALDGALVQFVTAADAGKAAMVLNNQEFEGRKVRVGLRADLVDKKGTKDTKPAKLMVPTALRRRRK